MAAFLWSHPTKEYRDVYMSPPNYMSIKDWVENQQILNIVALLGVLDTLRLVGLILIDALCILLIQGQAHGNKRENHMHTDLHLLDWYLKHKMNRCLRSNKLMYR